MFIEERKEVVTVYEAQGLGEMATAAGIGIAAGIVGTLGD